MINRLKSMVLMAIFTSLLAGLPVASRADNALQGITTPNADVTLSFVLAGKVSDVLVKAGAPVKKDQPLVYLYDAPEKIECQQLKMLSEDRTKILAAKAELAQKRADLKKVKMAHSKGAASDWEVEHLKLNVRIADLSLTSARFEQDQYRQRYEHARRQLERMRLTAPLAGRVEEIRVAVGESIGTLGPVIRIVQNDPLWIDVPVPIARDLELQIDQPAWVTFPGDADAKTAAKARIIHKSTVADAASDTLGIRIEVPNPDQRPAGERVAVAFGPGQQDNVNARLDVKQSVR